MAPPQLTFFCELDSVGLQALMNELNLEDLQALRASLSLGIVDFSHERAEVVRRLNAANIPVIAWLLLPKDQGYWFNLSNAEQATEIYAVFKSWTEEHNLRWAGVGLDIEPSMSEMEQLLASPWSLIPQWTLSGFNYRRFWRGQRQYRRLVSQIRADGYRVDVYQFPIIADERKAGSSLLRRTTGLVDTPADREVWMLYSSFFRARTGPESTPLGVGLIGSYAPEAKSVALGVTGVGMEGSMGVNHKPLSWEEFARDLRLAWFWVSDIHIYSLEGCVHQGFLPRLRSFDWDRPILLPEDGIRQVENWRGVLASALWMGSYLPYIIGALAGSFWFVRWLRRRKQNV